MESNFSLALLAVNRARHKEQEFKRVFAVLSELLLIPECARLTGEYYDFLFQFQLPPASRFSLREMDSMLQDIERDLDSLNKNEGRSEC